MKDIKIKIATALLFIFSVSCSTSYKATPMSFKAPAAYPNAQNVAGAVIGARAYVDEKEAEEAFGFDIRGAGMLPVQVAFDNQGDLFLEINPGQTFLEDREGNLWPILSSEIAYERVTKYTQTKQIFKEGAYHGFLGAVAGAIVGAAVGIVSGSDFGEAVGKGAAIGAAGGSLIGGTKGGYEASDARRTIMNDFKQKSLQSRPVEPKGLSFGFLFFPGEAKSAKQVRLQIKEKGTQKAHVLLLTF